MDEDPANNDRLQTTSGRCLGFRHEPEATLTTIAARYVWWQAPEITLGRLHHFLCQLMTLGTAEDVRAVRQALGDGAFLDALEHAPPGVMDPKSWNYWHLFFGRPPPPLPKRALPLDGLCW